MKRILILLLALTLLLATLACQPTPDGDIIVNKGDGRLDAAIRQTPSTTIGTPLRESLQFPQKWQGEVDTKTNVLALRFDAEVVIPQIDKAPVAQVSMREFTQEDLDTVKAAVFGAEAQLYVPYGYTRDEITQAILQLTAELEEEREHPSNFNDPNFWANKIENEIDSYKRLYNETPANVEKIPTNLKFRVEKNRNNEEYRIATATGSVGERNLMLEAYADGKISIGVPLDGGEYPEEYQLWTYESAGLAKMLDISKEEAARQAMTLAKVIDPSFDLAYVGTAWSSRNQKAGWHCIFTRTVNGVPTAFEFTERQGTQRGESELIETYAPDVYLERLCITFDDYGLAALEWIAPMQVDAIINDNVKLLDYYVIKEIAERQLSLQIPLWRPEEIRQKTIFIRKVELSLMRVRKQGALHEFTLIPVWDFYGVVVLEYFDENRTDDSEPLDYYSFLTINAIDGSAIDRFLGY
ncbi:MAG: DUF6034 family protein [Clostridiales bacterium]|nr:DUF6034 family protein [Clostridiales bacterium]